MSALATALRSFVSRYHSDPELLGEQAGWTCTITLRATDSGEAVTVQVEDGRIVSSREQPGDHQVLIAADAATLCDILELRRSPNEPYIFGELTVQGPQKDFMRLDYIAERLCPA